MTSEDHTDITQHTAPDLGRAIARLQAWLGSQHVKLGHREHGVPIHFADVRAVLAGIDQVDGRKWTLGARLRKKKGSAWHGKVVGFYSTELTPIGYAIESAFEPGSVQIYPENALEEWAPAERAQSDKIADGARAIDDVFAKRIAIYRAKQDDPRILDRIYDEHDALEYVIEAIEILAVEAGVTSIHALSE